MQTDGEPPNDEINEESSEPSGSKVNETPLEEKGKYKNPYKTKGKRCAYLIDCKIVEMVTEGIEETVPTSELGEALNKFDFVVEYNSGNFLEIKKYLENKLVSLIQEKDEIESLLFVFNFRVEWGTKKCIDKNGNRYTLDDFVNMFVGKLADVPRWLLLQGHDILSQKYKENERNSKPDDEKETVSSEKKRLENKQPDLPSHVDILQYNSMMEDDELMKKSLNYNFLPKFIEVLKEMDKINEDFNLYDAMIATTNMIKEDILQKDIFKNLLEKISKRDRSKTYTFFEEILYEVAERDQKDVKKLNKSDAPMEQIPLMISSLRGNVLLKKKQ